MEGRSEEGLGSKKGNISGKPVPNTRKASVRGPEVETHLVCSETTCARNTVKPEKRRWKWGQGGQKRKNHMGSCELKGL